MKIVEKIREEIEKRKNDYMAQATSFEGLGVTERTAYYSTLASNMASLILYIDSLSDTEKDFGIKSNDLEEAAHSYVDTTIEWFDSEGNPCCYPAFEAGAEWQKERDQSTIELAEDHAYLAGQEKIIEKACEWLRDNIDKYLYNTGGYEVYIPKCGGKMFEDFKKAMEE